MDKSDDDEEMHPSESIYVNRDLESDKLFLPTNPDQTQAPDNETPVPSQTLTTEQLLDHKQMSSLEKCSADQLPPCTNDRPPLGSRPKPVPGASSEQFSIAHQQTGLPRHRLTARELAAKALASDQGGWLTFDPKLQQKANLKYEVEEFLASYPPSLIREVDGLPVHWISARAPKEDGASENGSDSSSKTGKRDPMGLRQAWKDFLQSGPSKVTFQDIKKLAVAHRCLVGKWLVMKETGIHADLTWERIFRATVAGQLGISTKVSSAPTSDDSYSQKHVICVYSEDFTDKPGVMELERRLRQIGIRCRLAYKPDAFSYIGVYRNNEWGLRPTIYTSDFDVKKNASVVFSVYE